MALPKVRYNCVTVHAHTHKHTHTHTHRIRRVPSPIWLVTWQEEFWRQKPTQVGCQVKWRQRPISQEIPMIANEPPEARRVGWRKFCLTALRRNQHWQPSESWLPGSREWDITQIMVLCYDILGKLTQRPKSLGGRHDSQWLWKAGTWQEAAGDLAHLSAWKQAELLSMWRAF